MKRLSEQAVDELRRIADSLQPPPPPTPIADATLLEECEHQKARAERYRTALVECALGAGATPLGVRWDGSAAPEPIERYAVRLIDVLGSEYRRAGGVWPPVRQPTP